MPHATGWLPDPPDERDLHLRAIRGPLTNRARKVTGQAELPSKAELYSIMSPVRDQGPIGSCTAFAVGVGLAESIEIEHLRDPFFPLSPLFLYYATRLRSRQSKQDSGATLRATMKTMAKVGICPENLWPYTDVAQRFTQRPSKEAFGDTERFRFRKYYRVADLDDLKLAIASKNPVVGGFMLYPAFESAKVAKTGIVPMPGKREQSIGGHAMSVFGYDDNGGPDGRGHVVMKNSWGTDWGDRGMCFLPYDYFDTDAGLAVDLWTASL